MDKLEAFALAITSRPEHELILCCSRARVDQANSARIQTLIRGNIDWEYLLNMARRHSVFPLIYHQLKESALEEVPVPELKRLKQYYRDNLARNVLLTAELCSILADFESAGIDAVPFKGPALAFYAYGTLALRRFLDLDILIRKTDFGRAKEVLVSHGYRYGKALTEAQQSVLLHTQHCLAFTREASRMDIELHWEVAPDLDSSMHAEQLWKRLETFTLNDHKVKTLSTEDLLLSLCIHGTKHFWQRLSWICDVAELLTVRKELDWPMLVRAAQKSGTERMLFLGLILAEILLDAPLPANVKTQASSDRQVAQLAKEVGERLFDGTQYVPPRIGRTLRFHLRARTSLSGWLRYCSLLLKPTAGDITKIRLPAKLTFGYYLIRPFRLLWKSGSTG